MLFVISRNSPNYSDRRFAIDIAFLFSAFDYVAHRKSTNQAFVTAQSSFFRTQLAGAAVVTAQDVASAAKHLEEERRAIYAARPKPARPASIPRAAFALLEAARLSVCERPWSSERRAKLREKLMALS